MSRAEYQRAYRATRKALGRTVPRGADRPAPAFVAWDGEGESEPEDLADRRLASGPLWREAVASHAQELLAAAIMDQAPYWTALAEHGGRLGVGWFEAYGRLHVRGEFADIPRHLQDRSRRHGREGNVDKIADAAGCTTDELLAFFRDHPRRPNLRSATEQARLELEELRPRPRRHDYTLLANSRDGVVERGEQLDSVTILEALLAGRARHPEAVHVLFGGSYDATMALKDLPHGEAEALWKAGRHPVTVLGGRYAILYRPRRSFYVARWGKPRWLEGKPNYEARTTVWDVWGFFQASFVAALEAYGFAPELVAAIRAMKDRRPSFARADRQEVEAYCVRECQLLEQLMSQLAAALIGAGLRPRAWNGAGAVAAALLTREGVKAAIADPPEALREPVRRAYFGGRVELCQLGWRQGPVEVADVASAYPWATTELPDLHGSWQPTTQLEGFACYRVAWDLPNGAPWYPLPYRLPHGSILFPARGAGWYWRPEVVQAIAFAARFGGAVEVQEGWVLTPDSGARPFAFVPELYARRAAWKREGNGAEKAAKLGLNSLYGKMAQQLGGSVKKPPPFLSLAWAGWVTSATRARLVEAAIGDPGAVVSFATDGITSTRPLQLPDYGTGLGSWDVTSSPDGAFVQAGVYWLRQEAGWKAKYRGFDRQGLEEPYAVIEAWARGVRQLELACTRFVGIGSALCSEELWEARGTWRTVPRVLDLTGRSAKRMGTTLKDPKLTPLAVQWNVEYDALGALSAPYRLAWEPPILDGAPEELVEQEAFDSFT